MAFLDRFFQAPETSFFLFGPRGTGKSTFLRQAFADALWVDLLRPEVHQRFAARPERLRELVDGNREARVVVVDEVQRVPALLDVVHHLIERRGRRAAPRFVLSGSSARKLRRAGVNLLAGRLLLERMHPFMAAELPSFDLALALRRGMLPVVVDSDTPDATLDSYVALAIREEVQAEGLVRRLADFARFVEVISFSHGSVLNIAEVAREAQVRRKTTESYLGILEDLYLAFRLPVFRKRQKRQLTAHPKFYWFDAGVFRSARPAGPLDRPEEIDGGALEGLVGQHLRAWISHSRRRAGLFFWRTRFGNVVTGWNRAHIGGLAAAFLDAVDAVAAIATRAGGPDTGSRETDRKIAHRYRRSALRSMHAGRPSHLPLRDPLPAGSRVRVRTGLQ